MRLIRRILVILLATFMLFNQTIVAFAETNNNLGDPKENLLIDLSDSMSEISLSIKSLSDIDKTIVAPFSSKFESFMKYAGYAGTALGLVNGSVAFLQLIGVLQDPTAAKLINIGEQIQTINDKLNEMDSKLNDMASQMSKIEAKGDFHARDQKADYLLKIWKDFNKDYMEKGLDSLMTEYDAMSLNAIKNWCDNKNEDSRVVSDIDNNKIVILYKKNGNNYELIFNPDNTIPKGFSSEDRYIILNKPVLPKNVRWDVNNYFDDIKSEISSGIRYNLLQKNWSAFETQNYGFLTPGGAPKYIDQGPTLEIQKLSTDAASTLMYHIIASEVRKDARFTKNLIQAYNNYVDHFTGNEDGIDSVLKAMYLTHAFESQIRGDITDFLNRSIVKAGTYGLFVTNVLGMSNMATDTEKTTALEQFAKSIKKAKSAKENGITGRDNYSYITNTYLYLIDGSFTTSSSMNVRFGPGERRAYHSYSSDGFKFEHGYSLPAGSNFIGDINMEVLMLTLNSNGYPTSPETIIKFFGQSKYNYSEIMTSSDAPEDMTMDGSIKMSVQNVSGSWFPTGTYTNKLPTDATNNHVMYAKKLTGSIYNTNSGKLESKKVLSAIGIYAESRNSWFVDETAFMGGPTTTGNFSDHIEKIQDVDDTKVVYTTNNSYTAMYAVPVTKEEKTLLGSSNDNDDSYNPLVSYKNMSLDVTNKNTKTNTTMQQIVLYIGMGVGALILLVTAFVIIKDRKKKEN